LSSKGLSICNDVVYNNKKGNILITEPNALQEIKTNAIENLLLLYIFIEIKLQQSPGFCRICCDKCIEVFNAWCKHHISVQFIVKKYKKISPREYQQTNLIDKTCMWHRVWQNIKLIIQGGSYVFKI
jgi:hypothetical protein